MSALCAAVTLPAASTRNPGMKALSQAKLTAFFGKPCSSPDVSCANKVSGMFRLTPPA
jgi:hypothetical protein